MTHEEWTLSLRDFQAQINSQKFFDASFDEQHSRPQRKTYGHAPFATCTIMDGDSYILCMEHVDKGVMKSSNVTTIAGI